MDTGYLHSPCPRLYVNVYGGLNGHEIGVAFSRNIEYSKASPVIKAQILFSVS